MTETPLLETQLAAFRKYAVIDTETANHERGSLCSLAVLKYDGLDETGRLVTLVNPGTTLWTNTRIHGIGRDDVRSAPRFSDVLPPLRRLLSGSELLFAHSAPFDASVLREAARACGADPLSFGWRCTCQLAREAFPTLQNHRLPTVAARIGFDLRSHHDAESDAEACAAIVHALHRFPRETKEPTRVGGGGTHADSGRLAGRRASHSKAGQDRSSGEKVEVTLTREQLAEVLNSTAFTAYHAMKDADDKSLEFVATSMKAIASFEAAWAEILDDDRVLCRKEVEVLRRQLAKKSKAA